MRSIMLLAAAVAASSALAQTPNAIEAVEYDPDGNRWFVSNGSSLLVTENQGGNWAFFGEAQASHGMEVMGGALYAIGNNVIRAYDLSSAALLGELVIPGVGFLNGMGSNGAGLLVVSDFQGGRLYTINAEDPSQMSYNQLTGNLGVTPNGVVVDVANNRAIVVCWGNDADILSVDLESGDVITLVAGTGLGNLDGIDDNGNGQYYVSSWSPTRITRYSAEFTEAETVVTGAGGLSSPADISYAIELDTLGVANSGTDVVTFHGFGAPPSGIEPTPSFTAQRAASDILLFCPTGGMVEVTAWDASGRLVHQRSALIPAGQMRWPWPQTDGTSIVTVRYAGQTTVTLR